MPSDRSNRHEEYRKKLLGLGESSLHKNYYPELRKHMRELEESRTRYKTIFNATADALFIHDSETFNILDNNNQACQMFGYTSEEFLLIDFNQLCSGEDRYTRKTAMDYLYKTLNEGVQNFEWHCRKKDGTLFWTDVILKQALIDNKNCVIASVRDISSRKQLEEQLNQSQKMEAVGQLAGGVAHDFNNMLSGIMGSAEIIGKLSNNDKISELADVIIKAAETAGNLTKQLLSFSRKGSSKLKPLHLHQAISNATDILERSFDRNIELRLDLDAENDTIYGDLPLIENIIINMSLNARDAMPSGGLLLIQTENQVIDHNNHFRTQDSDNDYICLTITDTGTGMTENTRKHIFEPFFTTKDVGKGTGLGLAAVYGAVKRHNGYIEVESEIGRGSKFLIYLPITAPVTFENPEIPEAVEVSGSGTILLIDDEDIIRFVGEKMLTKLGYKVNTAVDGIEGISKFKENTPDLVLLDMVMPNMSSTDCFYELKKIDPQVPIIAVSGFTPDDTINNLFDNGLAGFMEKPYKLHELSSKIAAVMSKSKL